MKFICLHGAIGNAANYRVQLDAFCKNLEADKAASFFFVSGTVNTTEPDGFNGYFGPGPHYRFLEDQGLALHAMTEKIREFPDHSNPENTLRALTDDVKGYLDQTISPEMLKELKVKVDVSLRYNTGVTLNDLFDKMDQEGGVDGVIGYSEGALVAATLLLEDERRVVEEGQPRRLKAGIFFAGWPPLDPRTGHVVLADERDDMRIRVPTLHVIGSEDPYLAGSKALYNVCDEDTAMFFDHAKGHTLPQDARTIGELGITTRELIQTACAY